MPGTKCRRCVFCENCGSRLEVACKLWWSKSARHEVPQQMRRATSRIRDSDVNYRTKVRLRPTVPSNLPRRFSLSKAPLRVPTSAGQNFLIGYFLRGIHGVTQTSTRRIQVVWFLDFRSSYDFSFSPSKNRLIGRHYLMCEAR